MELNVNGRRVDVPTEWQGDSLLFTLREHLGLVGAKFGCGVGACGACTVLVDGAAERSCLLRPGDVAGRAVETIEGLAGPDRTPHPVQRAWLDEAVPQCGFCQAGQIMAATALLRRTPRPTAAEVDRALAGNLCRCGTQQRVRRAVLRAAATS